MCPCPCPAPPLRPWLDEKNELVPCVAFDKFDEVLTSTSPICACKAGSVVLTLDEDDQPPAPLEVPPPEPELLALIPIPCAHLRPILSTVRRAMPAAAEPTPMLIAVCRKDDGLLLGAGCECAGAARLRSCAAAARWGGGVGGGGEGDGAVI